MRDLDRSELSGPGNALSEPEAGTDGARNEAGNTEDIENNEAYCADGDGAGEDLPSYDKAEAGSENGEPGCKLIKAGRFLIAAFLAASSFVLFFAGRYVDAAVVAAALIVLLLFISVTERGQKYTLWPDKKAALLMCYSSYIGPSSANALFIPLKVRFAPLLAGFLGAALTVLSGLSEGLSPADITASAIACMCSTLFLGLGTLTIIALRNGISRLKQNDIDILKPEKLGVIARCDLLMADKTVFYGNKNAEISGVYTNGGFIGLSELSFEAHKLLLVGSNICSDEALGRAFGFKQRIGEVLLRAMRTSPVEEKEIARYKLTRRIPYDEETGITSAECCTPYGSIVSFTAGRPESLLPYIKYVNDDSNIREITPHELKRLRVILRQGYSAGRLAIALATGIPGESALTFLSFIFVTVQTVDDADKAVSDLKENGTDTLMVTDENETSAFTRASSLKVTADMSQVLTGYRIDNFRSGSLVRASLHARLAAETGSRHRLILGKILRQRRRVLAGASKNPDDTLLENAEIRITSEKTDSKYPPDVCSRTCMITDVAILVKTARTVASFARRASYQMLFSPMCMSLILFMCVALTGTVPFTPAVVAVSVLLLPLPQACLTASSDYGEECLGYMSIAPVYKLERRSAVKIPGAGYIAWWLMSVFVTVFSCLIIYGIYSPGDKLGVSAASAAAFLAFFFELTVNGIVSFVWGRSVFSIMEQGGRKMLLITLIMLAAVLGLIKVSSAAGLFGFASVPYRVVPAAMSPALLLLAAYELLTALRKKYEKRRGRRAR